MLRKIFIWIFIANLLCANTPDEPIKNTTTDLFRTASVLKESYASFVIGYEMLLKESSQKERKEGIYFALDRGWNFADNIILFGFSLDGSAGSFYALNLNTKLSARIFDGRIIPSISFGYGLLNHFVDDTQYNLHGANTTIALFVDIARGFGLEFAYRAGLYPFSTTKKSDSLKVKNIHAFMVNFKFIDFSF